MSLHPTADRLRTRLAQIKGIDTNTFDRFYDLVGRPDDLRGLVHVLFNLSDLVQLTKNIPGCAADHHSLDILETVAIKTLNGKKTDDEEVKRFFFNYPKMMERNFEGLKWSASVYSAIGHRPEVEAEWPRYRNLLAYLLDCHFQNEGKKVDIGETTVEEACLAIRELSYAKNLEILRQLPEELLSTDEFIEKLEEGAPPEGVIPSFPDLLRFIRRALGQRKAAEPSKRSAGGDPGNLKPKERTRYRREGGHPSDFKRPTS